MIKQEQSKENIKQKHCRKPKNEKKCLLIDQAKVKARLNKLM